MDKVESKEQSEEQELKDDLSEFQLRSLDIDIAFYGTKLKKTKKNLSFKPEVFWLAFVGSWLISSLACFAVSLAIRKKATLIMLLFLDNFINFKFGAKCKLPIETAEPKH